jgi:predicted TIM-barrel fold metal-dependent hydrolase
MTAEHSLTRRRFLQASAATSLSGLALAEQPVAAADDDLLIIDCHAHIYSEDEKKYPTIEKPYRPPEGKGTIRHLKQEMKANGVRHVTAIQTSTFYRFDNRFTSDSARGNSNFMVGVVTLDPDDRKSPAMLRRFVSDFNVRGMRSIAAKSGRLDDPGVDRLWATAEELGIVINVLTNCEKRGEIEALAMRHPKLRFVIDHCLNIKAGPNQDAIVKDVVGLSEIPNAYAKLSFIPTGTAEDWPCRDLHDACHKVIEAFSPQRLSMRTVVPESQLRSASENLHE